MTKLIKIPKRYYDDHRDCCGVEDTPKIVRETKANYFVESSDLPEWKEFVSRCSLYALDEGGDYWNNGWSGVVQSARATIKSIMTIKP